MDYEQIIQDYLDFKTTSELSSKYKLDKSDIKLLLRNSLPEGTYLKTAHALGARTVQYKLQNPNYRLRYIRKMKNAVRSSLTNKMMGTAFNERWQKKQNWLLLKEIAV